MNFVTWHLLQKQLEEHQTQKHNEINVMLSNLQKKHATEAAQSQAQLLHLKQKQAEELMKKQAEEKRKEEEKKREEMLKKQAEEEQRLKQQKEEEERKLKEKEQKMKAEQEALLKQKEAAEKEAQEKKKQEEAKANEPNDFISFTAQQELDIRMNKLKEVQDAFQPLLNDPNVSIHLIN